MDYLKTHPMVPARNYKLDYRLASYLFASLFDTVILMIVRYSQGQDHTVSSEKPSRNSLSALMQGHYIRLKWCAIFFLGSGLAGLQAQEAITAAGGVASGSGGSVSYSAGQVIYTTNVSSNSTITEGVQQPHEISAITGLEGAHARDLFASVYPNPTAEFLKLKVEHNEVGNLSYHLFDVSGKLLKHNKIISSETDIVMDDLVSATYLLVVTEEDKAVKILKIIKN